MLRQHGAKGADTQRNSPPARYGSEGWGFESLRARSVLRQTTRPLTSGNAGGGLARSRMHIGFIPLLEAGKLPVKVPATSSYTVWITTGHVNSIGDLPPAS